VKAVFDIRNRSLVERTRLVLLVRGVFSGAKALE
jgi:hypothetical protein